MCRGCNSVPCFTGYLHRTAAACKRHVIVPRDIGPLNEYRSQVAEEPFLISSLFHSATWGNQMVSRGISIGIDGFHVQKRHHLLLPSRHGYCCCFRNRRFVCNSGKSSLHCTPLDNGGCAHPGKLVNPWSKALQRYTTVLHRDHAQSKHIPRHSLQQRWRSCAGFPSSWRQQQPPPPPVRRWRPAAPLALPPPPHRPYQHRRRWNPSRQGLRACSASSPEGHRRHRPAGR